MAAAKFLPVIGCGKNILGGNVLTDKLIKQEPLLWLNSGRTHAREALSKLPFQMSDIQDAAHRLRRFAPLLQYSFPELKPMQGIIESSLLTAPRLQGMMANSITLNSWGNLYIKADNDLPIVGSIKARGGIYEVLWVAEYLAENAGLLREGDMMLKLLSAEVKQFFSQHTISVGSTGNLGLSVGIIAATLGFKTVVHMSADAKDWKKIVCAVMESRSLSIMAITLRPWLQGGQRQ